MTDVLKDIREQLVGRAGTQEVVPKAVNYLKAYAVWSLVFERVAKGEAVEQAVLSASVRKWLDTHEDLDLDNTMLIISAQHEVWNKKGKRSG
jgi:hypothetical protein